MKQYKLVPIKNEQNEGKHIFPITLHSQELVDKFLEKFPGQYEVVETGI